ncbi:MAG TPA: hypothetical protein VFJ16_05365 [Longimicrobium sp.]|nr:hypothetical protein [Longimicrobium sp.]
MTLPPKWLPVPRQLSNQRGVALVLVLLLVLAVGALALAAITLNGNTTLINQWDERQDELETVADAGLEVARSKLNASRALFPDSGYVTLENGAAVVDATGRTLPGVKRSTYAGPIGVSTGQYGVFGSLLSIARYANGDRVVRRADITQESFAKYAYFTDVEGSIVFGGGDQIQGPVHSNDVIRIHTTGATFKGPGMVTTAKTFSGAENASFVGGKKENAGRIELPPTAELTRLQGYASAGGTAFTEPSGGNPGTARMRIEFLWIDLNDNGAAEPDEGFFRVYVSNLDWYLMGQQPPGGGGWTVTPNCGFWRSTGAGRGHFVPPRDSGATAADKRAILTTATRRCFLGGDPTFQADSTFNPESWNTGNRQGWMPRPFAWNGALPAKINARPDRNYLFPLSRSFNPNFKGVIHVTGSVALSGKVRGRVTIAATDNIYIADDLTYAIQPGGSSDCQDVDMVGLFAGNNVVVSDNSLNTPQQIPTAGTTWYSFDDSNTGVFLQGVVLALNLFTVQNYDQGPTDANDCEASNWGRGCLYLSGGVIQHTRGAVGLSDGHGFLKRYSYDVCAAKKPPPYFPTTGRFSRSRYYEIDPVNFDVAAFYNRWNAGS